MQAHLKQLVQPTSDVSRRHFRIVQRDSNRGEGNGTAQQYSGQNQNPQRPGSSNEDHAHIKQDA